jgi:predicted phosphoadenosine phosphosulfate sulfurtransferase
MSLRNAVTNYEPRWTCWDPERQDIWVRQPAADAITSPLFYPFFEPGMEFEEFVVLFGEWYGQGQPCAGFVGIRADESLNRFRTIVQSKKIFRLRQPIFRYWLLEKVVLEKKVFQELSIRFRTENTENTLL